jgi:dihydroorotate dehydrogenase electron transfer subunit
MAINNGKVNGIVGNEQASLRSVEQPRMARIVEVHPETTGLCSLWVEHVMPFQPGQFIMVWVPELDEKPYAISQAAPGRIAMLVRARGPFSTRLSGMKPGEQIGLRGPYGRGFGLKPGGVIVAGGCGIAILAPLKDRLPDAPLIFGAQSANEVVYRKRFPDARICTDDGSLGTHGLPTELLKAELDRRAVSVVYTCGPEVMMRAVFDLCEARGVECQAALERYMKCGFGVCGQCVCGEMLVCRDGPVFNSAALRRMEDFGRTARIKTGGRVSVQEYVKDKGCSVRAPGTEN